MTDQQPGCGSSGMFIGIYITIGIVIHLSTGGLHDNLKIYSHITLSLVFQSVFVIALVVIIATKITKIHMVMSFSVYQVFKSKASSVNRVESNGNIALLPARIRFFGPLYLVLFLLEIPYWAQIEEEWFRRGTNSWAEAVLRSAVFGLVHLIVGVPLGYTFGIMLGGMWFSQQYFVGGLQLSTVSHATYNAIIVFALFVVAVSKHFIDNKLKLEQVSEVVAESKSQLLPVLYDQDKDYPIILPRFYDQDAWKNRK